MNRVDLLQRIRDAGVVGAGGAGFPTYKKLDASVEHIIVNGAECEPLLAKDRETMLHASDDLLAGIGLMQELTGARQVTLAVKQKNQDVLEVLGPALAQRGYQSFIYPDVYPAGDEYVLVYEITGRLIPAGGIPLQVGCITDNVETIVNVARAERGQPVTEKCITVCGAVRQPVTTAVPVGLSLGECLELAGGATVDRPVVLTGGLMMGGGTTDLSQPVTKTMGGVIALPHDHYLVRRKMAPRATYTRVGHGQCDQCSLCTELCPRYLLGYPIQPHLVMRTLLMTGEAKDRTSFWAQACCECNICSLIACPEQLDPKNICVDAKAQLRSQSKSPTPDQLQAACTAPHPARRGREIPIATLYQRLGLKPYDRQAPLAHPEIRPRQVTLRLDSHIGQPARPCVQVGDAVTKGATLATVPPDKLGVPVHASVDGRVDRVTDHEIQITC
jgi:Na+-translocating ferredoxin:NAD+ oxidoreductase RnfC subunit